jgi:hypothetical protein
MKLPCNVYIIRILNVKQYFSSGRNGADNALPFLLRRSASCGCARRVSKTARSVWEDLPALLRLCPYRQLVLLFSEA